MFSSIHISANYVLRRGYTLLKNPTNNRGSKRVYCFEILETSFDESYPVFR